MLQQQHPTIAGWLYNSYWKLNGEELTIFIGQEIGIRFLHNMRFTLQASVLLDEILQEKLIVQLQCDQAIKPPELQQRTEQVAFTKPAAKAAVKLEEKPSDEIVLLGKLIKDAPRPIESFEEEEKICDGRRPYFWLGRTGTEKWQTVANLQNYGRPRFHHL